MTLLAVDGNSIVNRAFYGIKMLTTSDGKFTNAIYGFLTMLEKIKDMTNPDAVAIAFDMRSPTFRHKAYDGYKAGRKGMPPELAEQFPVLKELLSALGYRLVECEGYEADDILGTLSAVCDKSGDICFIATGDRDALQLVTENVSVRLSRTKNHAAVVDVYDIEKIREEYGVEPAQLIDIKALQGDSSDNIPGVKGIGPKGAGDLIQRFGNIDSLYENIDSPDIKAAVRNKLIADKDNAYMSRMLGTICKDAPIDADLSGYAVGEGDKLKAAQMLRSLELYKFIEKWGLSVYNTEVMQDVREESETVILDTEISAHDAVSKAEKLQRAVFLADFDDSVLKGVYVYLEDRVAVFIGSSADDFLKGILPNGNIKKITSDSKQIFAFAIRSRIDAAAVDFDIQLAAYILNPSANSYAVDRLLDENNVAVVPYDESLLYDSTFAAQAAALPKLSEKIAARLDENGQTELLKNMEIPLARVLADMEFLGVKVDKQGIIEYGEMLSKKVNELTEEIYRDVGDKFNINSPKQLGVALFEKLGLPCSKKTKTGYSTSAEVLEGLRYAHPAIDKILEYRTLAKLKSTYCDGLVKETDENNRIHSVFNQTETRTGRISSLEPNLQNIPVRTEVGKELRRFFIARDGWTLVDADYSQIELRVLAHIADDKEMIKAFTDGVDVHTVTAAQVFNLPADMVNSSMRSRAKAVNFGIVYGIGAFSLSKDIGVTRKEADNYIKAYLAHYSGVDAYMNSVVKKAKTDGYVETMSGRRRYLPELNSSNHNMRSFGERVARNMPIQGTAADIIKMAMIRVYNRLKSENMQAKLILQVHDELIVEAPKEEAEKAAQILTEEMENAVKLSVPLTADANIGDTWYDAKG